MLISLMTHWHSLIMPKVNMNHVPKGLLKLFAVALIFVLPLPINALSSDAHQPMILLADRIHFQNHAHRTQLIGHIRLRQGSSKITADKAEALSDDSNKLIKAIASGKPAQFETTLEDRQLLVAQADKIIYLPEKQWIVLTGSANITIGQRHIKAPMITYDIQHQRVVSHKNSKQQPEITLPDATI